MTDLNTILIRELGKLGGFGARLAARFLPTVPYETTFDLAAPPDEVHNTLASLLNEIGHASSDLPELSVICGSGHLNLNPTILSASIIPLDSGSRVTIRAVAKEGLVKQQSAKKAVERVNHLIKERLA